MNPQKMLAVHVPVTYTIPGFEPEQAIMGVQWRSNEPMALRLVFNTQMFPEETVEWIVSRDMFADCYLGDVEECHGQGDAMLEKGLVSTYLSLNSPEGLAAVTFFTQPVMELITKSLMICPRGEQESEGIADELDEFLGELLS